GRVVHEVVDQVGWIEITEETKASTNNRVMRPTRLPGRTNARLEHDILDAREGAVQVIGDHLVEGLGWIMVQGTERPGETSNAISLASLVGVAVGREGQGQFKVLTCPPLVLGVQAETVNRHRIGVPLREALADLIQQPRGEVCPAQD